MAGRCDDCNKLVLRNQFKAVRKALRVSARYGKGFRIYRCPVGRGWHLTTRREWKETTR
jgi:hypothetical protein